MSSMTRIAVWLSIVIATACASGARTDVSTATLGPAGGTLKTANVRLDVPAGALQAQTQITVRETQGPSGTVRRVEIDPTGLALAAPARVSMRDDGSRGPFRMGHVQNQQWSALGRYCEDASWHQHSGDLPQLATVDLAHGAVCNPACAANQYCVDGVCRTPDALCSECGAACGPSGCDGWMCGCCGGECGCPTCCNGGQCCSGGHCCDYGNGMCCGEMCCMDGHC